MSQPEFTPPDPLAIANRLWPYAPQQDELLDSIEVQHRVSALNEEAMQHSFVDTKFAAVALEAFALPAITDDPRMTHIPVGLIPGVSFEGDFSDYSQTSIRPIGFRGLCLVFKQVTLFPYFDALPEDRVLHVPTQAIKRIHRIPT